MAATEAEPATPMPLPLPMPPAVTVAATVGAPAPVIPPCPNCRAPMLWVSKRKTWLCTVCKARDSVPA